jgi:enoyl-CoA hydratase
MTETTRFEDVVYRSDGAVATVTLDRPRYRNAQSYRLLDEIDRAFDLARADDAVRVVVLRGAGGHFSSGHDLGTEEGLAFRRALGPETGVAGYDRFKHYNLDLLLRWRDFPKPTIAMVEGFCIYAGWMLAAAMDVVFAASDAKFLGGFVEYNSIPWDVGARRAKELCFESRFITADEAAGFGLVNRVIDPAALEAETYAYAARVAENDPLILRMVKINMNKAQDAQGFRAAVEDSLGDYVAMMNYPGYIQNASGERRLGPVALAAKGLRGERAGQTPDVSAAPPPSRRGPA